MPGRKKKFIDKKNAVTFHLVHRSQRDPLQADEDAPSHVLLQQVSEQDISEARKAEQRKYGVFFDDDYDYLQHLKDVNELREVGPTETFRIDHSKESKKKKNVIEVLDDEYEEPKLKLPSSVFGSEVETDVGLLNKAAPQPGPKIDWDPDVVAALDDDFNFDDPENQLEDDFILMANAEGDDYEDDMRKHGTCETGEDTHHPFGVIREDAEDMYSEEGYPSDEADYMSDDVSDVGSLGQHSFQEEETKSRFTAYSMTSSVIRRNEGLTLLDDRFEQLYAEYDDTELGALDHEEIEGTLQQNSVMLNSIMDEFEKEQEKQKLKDTVKKAEDLAVMSESEEEDPDGDLVRMTMPQQKEEWDCQSILSTYSNLYNHPKLIDEPRQKNHVQGSRRQHTPGESVAERGLSQREIRALNQQNRADKAGTYRPKDETAEERRTRKGAIKEERKMRREEKKANKKAFKSEKIRQDKELINLQKNLQGIKMV